MKNNRFFFAKKCSPIKDEKFNFLITNQNVLISYSFIYLTKFLEVALFSAILLENKISFSTTVKLLLILFLLTILSADWKNLAVTHVLGRKPWVPPKTSAPSIFWPSMFEGRTAREWDLQKLDTVPIMQHIFSLFHISNARAAIWFLQQPCESEDSQVK